MNTKETIKLRRNFSHTKNKNVVRVTKIEKHLLGSNPRFNLVTLYDVGQNGKIVRGTSRVVQADTLRRNYSPV